MGRGDHPRTFLLIVLFYQGTPSCLKVIGGVVAHKILLSAPVPIDPLVLGLLWFGMELGLWGPGLGLGLDNFVNIGLLRTI